MKKLSKICLIFLLYKIAIVHSVCDPKIIDTSELGTWSLVGKSGADLTTICDGYTIMGGFNIFG